MRYVVAHGESRRRFWGGLTLTEGDDGIGSASGSASAYETRDWRSLYEQERARAGSLKSQNAELRKESAAHRKAARSAQTSLSTRNARLLEARESSQAQKDTIRSLHRQVRCLEGDVARLSRELEEAENVRQTARRLSDQVVELRVELRDLNDQSGVIESLSRRLSDLDMALIDSAAGKQRLETQLADRPLLPVQR